MRKKYDHSTFPYACGQPPEERRFNADAPKDGRAFNSAESLRDSASAWMPSPSIRG
ncbi:MAG: hypothetical protein WCT14_09295 [Treponemataceae bacterium]